MSDGVSINGGKSRPEVAFNLMVQIAEAEGKKYSGGGWNGADRAYILNTFVDAYKAAGGVRPGS